MNQRPSRMIAAAIAEHQRRYGKLSVVVVSREMYAELCEEVLLTQGQQCSDSTELFVCGIPVLLEAEEGEVLQ